MGYANIHKEWDIYAKELYNQTIYRQHIDHASPVINGIFFIYNDAIATKDTELRVFEECFRANRLILKKNQLKKLYNLRKTRLTARVYNVRTSCQLYDVLIEDSRDLLIEQLSDAYYVDG